MISEIQIGMDVSGDQEFGNHKFMGIVMGTKDSMRSTFNRLGNKQIHMSNIIGKEQQDEIISKIRFDNREIAALCARIDRNRIIQNLMGTQRMKKKRIPHESLLCISSFDTKAVT